jgi:hypothetical protein
MIGEESQALVFGSNSIAASLPASFHLVPLRRSTIEIPITQIMLVVSMCELLPESRGCFGAVNSLNGYYHYCV